MWKTILRRFLILIPQLFILSVLLFLFAQAMPGDALRGRIGPDTHPDLLAELRAHHGLDQPWHVQYWRWLTALAQGDFGTSHTFQRPVTEVVGDSLANTMRLAIVATILTYLIAIPLGLLAAKFKGKIVDKAVMMYTFVALSMPTLILGLFFILVFALRLEWFPSGQAVDIIADGQGGWTRFVSQMHHVMLPAITMALLGTVSIIYFLRGEIIDNDSSDFVTTARSKGVPNNRVYTRHILRNALLPVAGNFGAIIASLFTGSLFIEVVFTYRGMGQLFVNSLQGRDYPVIFALTMFFAVVLSISFLVTDIIITILDPRIRIK
ncbi:MAG: ABC transporter permease [Defluviitaleaceae bacterium]|nr:ABC transporter permease [Defluviitaleaceae bacterium]